MNELGVFNGNADISNVPRASCDQIFIVVESYHDCTHFISITLVKVTTKRKIIIQIKWYWSFRSSYENVYEKRVMLVYFYTAKR